MSNLVHILDDLVTWASGFFESNTVQNGDFARAVTDQAALAQCASRLGYSNSPYPQHIPKNLLRKIKLMGAAVEFSVLGGSAVTCTSGVVSGNTGLFPGSAFTNTLCTFIGETPPANNAVAALARTDFLAAYAALRKQSKECTVLPGNLADQNLAPGVYCLDSVAKTGNLTLNGPVNGEWTFLVNGALTGTNFSVAMAGGGKPCNVFWATNAGVTMTTSSLKGNILAGDAIDGSITLTGGNLVGSVLANVAMTITGTSVISCGAL